MGTNYALGHLMWSDFKLEVEAAFCDVDRELKLCCHFAGLHQTINVASYTKELCHIAFELGD